VAATGARGAGAVRVRGAPSGGVSGAGPAADDVGLGHRLPLWRRLWRVAFLSPTCRDLGSDEPTRRPLRRLELSETITSLRGLPWARMCAF
jgi:hypothetical protein